MKQQFRPTNLRKPEYTHRWVRFVRRHDEIKCPDGHPLPNNLTWEYGGLVCKHQYPIHRMRCGKLILLMGGGLKSPDGEPILIAVEVSSEEMGEMERKRMSWDESARFLGLWIADLNAA